MEKIAALVLAMFFALGMQVMAQEEAAPGDELVAGTGGIAPDNILYGLDVALDNIWLALTFDPAARAQLGLQIAEERLLEAKAMAEQGRAQAARAAIEQYGAALNVSKAAMRAIHEDGNANMTREAM